MKATTALRLFVVVVVAVWLLLCSFIQNTEPSRLITSEFRRIGDVPAKSERDVQQTERIVIAYVVSVTACQQANATGLVYINEGAAVLKHSIQMASSLSSRYGYQMYAIVHPSAEACGRDLEELGYTILARDTPVAVQDIRAPYLRKSIQTSGCCGEKEYVKLEVFTLTDHPIAVHLDLDALVLKPMDDLFDLMLNKHRNGTKAGIMWTDQTLPPSIDAFYTKDYNLVQPKRRYKPTQGGFLVVRPSIRIYQEFVDIIREGDFQEGKGWGGQVGPFYGAMTIQGILPYYYEILNKSAGVELNRCLYNQMADNPRIAPRKGETAGKCRTKEASCEDCRERPLEDVLSVHFTCCQKPWWCLPSDHNTIQQRLCRQFLHKWFDVRSDLEKSWGRLGVGPYDFQTEHFHGFCKSKGERGYLPIAKPYGRKVATTTTTTTTTTP